VRYVSRFKYLVDETLSRISSRRSVIYSSKESDESLTSTSPSVSLATVKSYFHHNSSLFKFSFTVCRKRMYAECFVKKRSKKEWFRMVEPNTIFYSKKSFDKAKRAVRAQPGWLFDGSKGPNNSGRILLDWLLVPGNYASWRGCTGDNGKRKKDVALRILKLMNNVGVKVHRDEKQVSNKTTYMEKAFREAHDFANTETGVGLQETDRGNFQDIVRKRFSYYFHLLEIFGDRASSKPKVTSYDDLSEVSQEENEDDDGGSREVKAKDVLKRKLTESAYSIQKRIKVRRWYRYLAPR